jgi:hypothetical protein
VVARATGRLLRGQAEKDPRARLADWGLEASQLVRTLRDLLHRVEREEFRVRWHPRDTAELQRQIAQQVRRLILAAGALTLGIVTAIVYLATRRLEILVLGLFAASGLFSLVFVLPSHLFQNPLRIRRRRR